MEDPGLVLGFKWSLSDEQINVWMNRFWWLLFNLLFSNLNLRIVSSGLILGTTLFSDLYLIPRPTKDGESTNGRPQISCVFSENYIAIHSMPLIIQSRQGTFFRLLASETKFVIFVSIISVQNIQSNRNAHYGLSAIFFKHMCFFPRWSLLRSTGASHDFVRQSLHIGSP